MLNLSHRKPYLLQRSPSTRTQVQRTLPTVPCVTLRPMTCACPQPSVWDRQAT